MRNGVVVLNQFPVMVASYKTSMGGSGKASLGSARRKFRVQYSALSSWGMVGCGEFVCALSKAVAVTVILAHIPRSVNCTSRRD